MIVALRLRKQSLSGGVHDLLQKALLPGVIFWLAGWMDGGRGRGAGARWFGEPRLAPFPPSGRETQA